MGLSLKSLGKSISKAFKGVGKTLQKAAPILIPLAVTAATGGFGGSIAGKLSGALGKVGSTLLKGLGGAGGLGGIIKSGPVDNGELTQDTVAQEPGGARSSGNFIGDFLQKAAPTLLTQLIDGKPKSASKEAAKLYANAPTMTPAQTEMANLVGSGLKDSFANPERVSPLSTNARGPMTFGDPMQAASSPQNSAMNRRANYGASPAPEVLSAAAPKSMVDAMSKPESSFSVASQQNSDANRRASYRPAPVLRSSASPDPFGATQQPGFSPAMPTQQNSSLNPANPLSPVTPAGMTTGGAIGSFAAPVVLTPEQIEMNRNRPRGFALRGRM